MMWLVVGRGGGLVGGGGGGDARPAGMQAEHGGDGRIFTSLTRSRQTSVSGWNVGAAEAEAGGWRLEVHSTSGDSPLINNGLFYPPVEVRRRFTRSDESQHLYVYVGNTSWL